MSIFSKPQTAQEPTKYEILQLRRVLHEAKERFVNYGGDHASSFDDILLLGVYYEENADLIHDSYIDIFSARAELSRALGRIKMADFYDAYVRYISGQVSEVDFWKAIRFCTPSAHILWSMGLDIGGTVRDDYGNAVSLWTRLEGHPGRNQVVATREHMSAAALERILKAEEASLFNSEVELALSCQIPDVQRMIFERVKL
jgi:hypothetical protein